MTLYSITCWILVIICPVILYNITPVLLNNGAQKKKKRIYLFLHTLFLTIITILIFNQPDSITANQEKIVDILRQTASNQTARAQQYLEDNFILIDDAHDQSFIRFTGEDSNPFSNQAITNRKHITDFINWCADNQASIDLVVCDVNFRYLDKDSVRLKRSLIRLAHLNKLLVAEDGTRNFVVSDLPERTKGRVSEQSWDDRFNTHQISWNGQFSLDYKLYTRLDSVSSTKGNSLFLLEKRRNGIGQLRMNTFFPFLYINNENFHWAGNSKPNQALNKQFPGFKISNARFYHTLENLTTDSARFSLMTDLLNRKQDHLKNILFVGAFKGDIDQHRTIFGQLHGSVILLNLVYNLHVGNNVISIKLLLMLFIGFWLIITVLLRGVEKALLEEETHKNPHHAQSHYEKMTGRYKHISGFIYEFLKEHVYWAMLAFVILAIYYATHVLLNIAGLIFYLLTFRSLLLAFARHKKIKITAKPYKKSDSLK